MTHCSTDTQEESERMLMTRRMFLSYAAALAAGFLRKLVIERISLNPVSACVTMV